MKKVEELKKQIEILQKEIEVIESKKSAEILPFEELDWKSFYYRMLEYVKLYQDDDHFNDDAQYLYEDVLQFLCPNIFK